MAGFNVPSNEKVVIIPLGAAEGRSVRSLQLFQSGDAVTVDLRLDEGLSVELLLRVGFGASATLLNFERGNARIVEKLKPPARRKRPSSSASSQK